MYHQEVPFLFGMDSTYFGTGWSFFLGTLGTSYASTVEFILMADPRLF